MADVEKSETNSKAFALRIAQNIGCTGAHKKDGKWMPCSTMEELQEISASAEPKKKTALVEVEERFKRRSRKGKKRQWENLGQRGVAGIDAMENGGIVSAPIVSVKAGIPGLAPRDSDDDVYTEIESARKRSVRLGCIGVRRLVSQSGRTVWMPCTTNTDYARLAGTTALGRRHQRQAANLAIRKIVSEQLKNPRRKKSLFDEMYEEKGLGRAIGRAVGSGSRRGKIRRAIEVIDGILDPRLRRDVDGDGFIFDGTSREMPDPTRAIPDTGEGLTSMRRSENRLSDYRDRGVEAYDPTKPRKPSKPTRVNPSDISVGGNLKAREILRSDRLRNRSRQDQATMLGVSVDVIEQMEKPDATIDPYAADRLADALNLNPTAIWGDDWLKPDITEEAAPKRTRKMRELDDRDRQILKMRDEGKTLDEIGKELGITKTRVNQLLKRAIESNSREFDKGSRKPNTIPTRVAKSSGMVKRDATGKVIIEKDVRKEVFDKTVESLKKLGMTEDEINILLGGKREANVTPESANSPSVLMLDNPMTGLRSARKKSIPPSEWPESEKKHYLNWANARPSFVVPYSLVVKYNKDKFLSDKDWRLLKQFYDRYGANSRSRNVTPMGLRSTSTYTGTPNVGAKRMGQIILGRVQSKFKGERPGQRKHHAIIGAPGMGKTSLYDFLSRTAIIPGDSEAAHIDPDFVKQGMEGYNGGAGAGNIHRESAMAAMHIYRDAVKEQMDIVTEGTGKRLMDYLNLAKGYEMVGHAAWIPPSGAKERIRKRKLEDGREIAEYIVDHIADVSYDLVARHLRNGEMSSFYLWDTDVPKGAAPKLIAKVEGGVFVVNDEDKFKSWSTGGRGGSNGDKNLSYFKKKYAKSQ